MSTEIKNLKVITANCEKLFKSKINKSVSKTTPYKNEFKEEILLKIFEKKPDIIFLQEVLGITFYDLKDKNIDGHKALVQNSQTELIDNIQKITTFIFKKSGEKYIPYYHKNYRLVTIIKNNFLETKGFEVVDINNNVYEKFFIQTPARLQLNSLVKFQKYDNAKFDEDPVLRTKDIKNEIYEKSEARIYEDDSNNFYKMYKNQNTAMFLKDIVRSVLNERTYMQYLKSNKEILVLVNVHMLARINPIFEDLEIINFLKDDVNYKENIKNYENVFDVKVFYSIVDSFLEFLRGFIKSIHPGFNVNFIIGGDFNGAVIPSTQNKLSIFKSVKNNSEPVRTYFKKNFGDWKYRSQALIKFCAYYFGQKKREKSRFLRRKKMNSSSEKKFIKNYLLNTKGDKVGDNNEIIITDDLLDHVYWRYTTWFGEKVNQFQVAYYSNNFDNILYNFEKDNYTLVENSVKGLYEEKFSKMTFKQYNSIINSNGEETVSDDNRDAAKLFLADMIKYYISSKGYYNGGWPSDHNAIEATFKKKELIVGIEESKIDTII